MPNVTIVLPTFNRAVYLKDAIESVLAQTYRDFEFIIVDDGSTDNTEEVVASYINDPRIRYLKQANSGAAAARNHGISLRRGDLVAFIDSDDIWNPDKLLIETEVLKELPDTGIVCSDFSAEGSSVIEPSHIRTYFSVLNDYNLEYRDVFSNRLERPVRGLAQGEEVYWGNIFNTMLFGNIILTSTCLCRASLFETIGVFDPSYSTLEDYDFFLRITKKIPVAFIAKPLIRYRYSENQLSGENHFDRVCANLIGIFSKNVAALDDKDFLNKNRLKLRRRLGEYQAMQGYFRFSKEEMTEAAQSYRQSICNNPFKSMSYIYLLFSVMPVGASRLVRKIKSKILH
jgi:glycosyltransferase involved in cell wall biosynthesis